jgi:SOS response regulatory protein OraA/RecX
MTPRIKKDANYMSGLVDYAKKNLQKGYNKDSLKWALVNQGHSKMEVEKALAQAASEVETQRAKQPISQPTSAPTVEMQVEPEQPKSFWKRIFG